MASKTNLILSIVIAGYFTSVILAVVPLGTGLAPAQTFITHWLECLGLYQTWNLFSPEVRNSNFYTSAVVTFADGTTRLYEFPRLNEMDQFARFQKQKMRKLFVDCWASAEMIPLREWEAKFVARCHANPANEPRQVALCLHWSIIPKPSRSLNLSRDLVPGEVNRQIYYVYQVQPEDLN